MFVTLNRFQNLENYKQFDSLDVNLLHRTPKNSILLFYIKHYVQRQFQARRR